MQIDDLTSSFKALNSIILKLSDSELERISTKAKEENPWFTKESIALALQGISLMTSPESLDRWVGNYSVPVKDKKKVGIVMAGNIPAVGFHDLLCVLISGNIAHLKMSHKDQYLIKYLINELEQINPAFKSRIVMQDKLEGFDAVIATGSSNSSRYFEYYFGKYPHIIRKNRNSVAVIHGDESDEELKQLGKDVFYYFGLGCRNVSKLYIQKDFDITRLGDIWSVKYSSLVNHHKYANNYDYRRSIYLVNRDPILDFGNLILKENEEISTPIAVINYHKYEKLKSVEDHINVNREKIQCVVSANPLQGVESIAPGKAQFPSVDDYADNVDTMRFLSEL